MRPAADRMATGADRLARFVARPAVMLEAWPDSGGDVTRPSARKLDQVLIVLRCPCVLTWCFADSVRR